MHPWTATTAPYYGDQVAPVVTIIHHCGYLFGWTNNQPDLIETINSHTNKCYTPHLEDTHA